MKRRDEFLEKNVEQNEHYVAQLKCVWETLLSLPPAIKKQLLESYSLTDELAEQLALSSNLDNSNGREPETTQTMPAEDKAQNGIVHLFIFVPRFS
jgi:hypothetical protein